MGSVGSDKELPNSEQFGDPIFYILTQHFSAENSWSFGPKLPYRMVGTSMVTAPGGKGVIVIGGLVNYYDEKEGTNCLYT